LYPLWINLGFLSSSLFKAPNGAADEPQVGGSDGSMPRPLRARWHSAKRGHQRMGTDAAPMTQREASASSAKLTRAAAYPSNPSIPQRKTKI